MSRPKIAIAIVGCFQNGKSTLVNCLLDDKVAQTGFGLSTTHISTTYRYGEVQTVSLSRKNGNKPKPIRLAEFLKMSEEGQIKEYSAAEVTLWKPLLEDVDIIDTPGFNANESDSICAMDSIKDADFVLVLLRNGQLSEGGGPFSARNRYDLPKTETALMDEIAKRGLPFSVIINCYDIGGAMWDPKDKSNSKILSQIESKIKALGHDPIPINGRMAWPCNLIWFWMASEHLYSEKEEEIKRVDSKMKTYFMSFNDGRVPRSYELAEMSNFLPVRDFFQTNTWHIISPGSIQCRAALEQSIINWGKEIDHTLQNLKDKLR